MRLIFGKMIMSLTFGKMCLILIVGGGSCGCGCLIVKLVGRKNLKVGVKKKKCCIKSAREILILIFENFTDRKHQKPLNQKTPPNPYKPQNQSPHSLISRIFDFSTDHVKPHPTKDTIASQNVFTGLRALSKPLPQPIPLLKSRPLLVYIVKIKKLLIKLLCNLLYYIYL